MTEDKKKQNDKNTSQDTKNPKKIKKLKRKGPLRTEVLIPILIVSVLTYLYFHFLFDLHLKKGIEWAGYQAVGAEVNIKLLKTSFLGGTFQMQGLELTNSEKPSHNMVVLGDIRFGLLWDALLRGKFVVNEMAVEKIEINSPRSRPGKVKPPEPPKPPSNKPSALEKEGEKIKDQTLNKVKDDYSGNILGDLAALLNGANANDQMKNVEGTLPSKAQLKEFEILLDTQKKKWDEKFKTLPNDKDIKALGDKINKVKTKDFKTPQELTDSLKELENILKEGDKQIKTIQATSSEFNTDLATLDKRYKEINEQINKDIKSLEARFKIPKLDANSLSQAIFKQYLKPYMAKVNNYKAMADKYVPPNLMKKTKGEKSDEPDISIQARPRAKGMSYEFGRQNSYPLFWVKRISVSSQAGASPEAGNISGEITHVTSNQVLIGHPTRLEIKGDFPGMQILGMNSLLVIDNTKATSLISFDFGVSSFPIDGRSIIESPDLKIGFKKASASLKAKGDLKDLSRLKLSLDNQLEKIDYEVSSPNTTIDEIVKNVFKVLPKIFLEAKAEGDLPDIPFDIQSNLGSELQKGFETQLQKKIDEAKQKLQAYIDEQVGKEKKKIEEQYNKYKNQVDGELKKANDQLNQQKAQVDSKVVSAKKEANDQIEKEKKRAEDELKKKFGKEGQKAVDDLKKKFGF